MIDKPIQVIKISGDQLDQGSFLEELIQHLRGDAGHTRTILVHGGGEAVGALHQRLSVPFRQDFAIRATSEQSMELVTMVLCGLINKRLVAGCNSAGLSALGLCGADLSLLQTEFLNYGLLGRVGGPPRVDTRHLRSLLETVDLLIVSPVSLGPDGGLVNISADLAAQSLAVALAAERLDFITSSRQVHIIDNRARSLAASKIAALIDDAKVTNSVIPALQAGLAALDGGVARVRVGDLASLRHQNATELRV